MFVHTVADTHGRRSVVLRIVAFSPDNDLVGTACDSPFFKCHPQVRILPDQFRRPLQVRIDTQFNLSARAINQSVIRFEGFDRQTGILFTLGASRE